MKSSRSSSGWVSVSLNKASRQQMMRYTKKCYGGQEAGGGGWRRILEAHRFFPFYNLLRQLGSLQAVPFQDSHGLRLLPSCFFSRAQAPG